MQFSLQGELKEAHGASATVSVYRNHFVKGLLALFAEGGTGCGRHGVRRAGRARRGGRRAAGPAVCCTSRGPLSTGGIQFVTVLLEL